MRSIPDNPLAFRALKNSVQLASVSLLPICVPKISRWPDSFIPTAIKALWGRTRPSSLIFMTIASTRAKGNACQVPH